MTLVNLDALFNSLQDLVYVTDPKRVITYANQAFADIFGYDSPKEIIGKSIADLYVDPEHRFLLEQSIGARGGRVINYLVYVKRTDGECFCLSVDSSWIGGIRENGISGTGRDLTDLVEFLGCFFQVDVKGVMTFCSPSFARLFGYTCPTELIGKDIQVLLPTKFSSLDFSGQISAGHDARPLMTTTVEVEDKNHRHLHLRISIAPINQDIYDLTELVGYQGTFEDITASEEARLALAESHRIRNLLMEKSQDSIYVIQGDRITLYNAAFRSLMVRDDATLSQIPYLDLIHPEDQKRVKEQVERKLAGEDLPPYNFRIITGDDKERTVRAFSGHCTISQIDSVYGYLRDITDELRREEELQKKIDDRTKELKKAFEDKEALLETVVHELDAPTVAIQGIVERLMKGVPTDKLSIPKQMMKLSDIDQLCELMFRLERNVSLAEFEKVSESGRKEYCHIETDLIQRAIYYTKPLLRNRDLPLDRTEVHLHGAPAYIIGDKDHFLQVFFNIISNAIKYAQIDKDIFKIEVSSNYSTIKGLALYFKDWGVGIPDDQTTIIFDKGQRGQNATNNPGMGLGLWVAKRVLDAYKCDICVEQPRNPTTFAVKIPADRLAWQRPREVTK